jgi:hypothetical protein
MPGASPWMFGEYRIKVLALDGMRRIAAGRLLA